VEHWADQLLLSQEVVPLFAEGTMRQRLYSTAGMLATEQRALGLANELAAYECARVPQGAIAEVPISAVLTAKQLAVAESLVAGSRGLALVIGKAGSGKTSTLAVANRVWVDSGHAVIGAAVAAKAARHLQDSTGIVSMSMSRLVGACDRVESISGRPALPPGAVLVVDEAGMVGTRAMARLLEIAVDSGSRVVLLGDPRQLPAIESGGLFAALARRHPTLVLDDNLRQTAAWEREALDQLREGNVAQAVRAYVSEGRVVMTSDRATLWSRLVDDWFELHRASGGSNSTVVVTAGAADAAGLNLAIHNRLVAEGRVAAGGLVVDGERLGPRQISAGDEVIVTRNTYEYGLLNGTRATVMATLESGDGLRLRDDRGRVLDLPEQLVSERIALGYVVTCHKAQGTTSDICLVYGTRALSRESGYVALSRGRDENRLYVVEEELDRFTSMASVVPETDDLRKVSSVGERLDHSGRLVETLERQASKQLASELKDSPTSAAPREPSPWATEPSIAAVEMVR
jgi:ATP-dependent exoDNAse (exonuclease V) alpha subunit